MPREKRRAIRILSSNGLFESFSSYINKLSDFHYLPSTKTPTSGRKPDDYQLRAQIKQIFQEGKLKAGDKKAMKEFSEKYGFSEKLVADYFEYLTDIEMRKDKRRTDNDS